MSSQPPNKRIKTDRSLDPLKNLSSDVFELVFQHFDRNETIKCSEVSPLWFKETETSLKCVEKLEVKIVVPYYEDDVDLRRFSSKDFQSQRKYQKLFIQNFEGILPDILKILSREESRWRKVIIVDWNFKSAEDFNTMMNLIEPTVEELTLWTVKPECPAAEIEEHIQDTWTFPNLRNFGFKKSNVLLLEKLLKSCCGLRTLVIDVDYFSMFRHRQKFLREILSNNTRLENLSMLGYNFFLIFAGEFTANYQFRLKSFSLRHETFATGEDESGFSEFLMRHGETLNKLKLHNWMGIESFRQIFRLPKLKEFTADLLGAGRSVDWDNLRLCQSSSIEKFHLTDYMWTAKTKIFNAVFSAMPNLKLLAVNSLGNISLRSIATRCQLLEELKTEEFNATQIDSAYFPNMKLFRSDNRIATRIKRRIHIKPKDQRSPFEELVLCSVPYCHKEV